MRNANYTRLVLALSAVVIFFLSFSPVSASSANLSHSYNTITAIANGSIVSLDSTKTKYVVPANTGNSKYLLGVAVAPNDSLLAIDPTTETNKVQIATTGTATTLVSTVGGDIKVGDEITTSPFNGLGMKSTSGAEIIGLAQTAFNKDTVGATKKSITDIAGKTSQVYVGYIKVGIAIGGSAQPGSDNQLTTLQKSVKSFSGRTVSSIRATLIVIIALVSSISLIVLIYASIYGSIISIGRNPLAKYAVFRSLTSVLGMALLIASVTGFTIFILLL